jgi:hypothetical protein
MILRLSACLVESDCALSIPALLISGNRPVLVRIEMARRGTIVANVSRGVDQSVVA